MSLEETFLSPAIIIECSTLHCGFKSCGWKLSYGDLFLVSMVVRCLLLTFIRINNQVARIFIPKQRRSSSKDQPKGGKSRHIPKGTTRSCVPNLLFTRQLSGTFVLAASFFINANQKESERTVTFHYLQVLHWSCYHNLPVQTSPANHKEIQHRLSCHINCGWSKCLANALQSSLFLSSRLVIWFPMFLCKLDFSLMSNCLDYWWRSHVPQKDIGKENKCIQQNTTGSWTQDHLFSRQVF